MIAILPAYWLTANLLLATGVVERWISSEAVDVALEGPWSLVPGRINAREVKVQGHGSDLDWSLRADRLRAKISIPALLERRLDADSIQLRNIRLDFGATATSSKTVIVDPFPSIHAAALAQRVSPARDRSSAFVVRHVRGTLSEISTSGVRYGGRTTADGSFRLTRGGDLERVEATLNVERGALEWQDGRGPSKAVLSELRGLLRVEYGQHGRQDGLQGLSASIDAKARVDPESKVMTLGRSAGLELEETGGRLSARFSVRRGRIERGGGLRFEADQVRVYSGALTAEGKLHAQLTAAGSRDEGRGYDLALDLDGARVRTGPMLLHGDLDATARLVSDGMVSRIRVPEVEMALSRATLQRGSLPPRPWEMKAQATNLQLSRRESVASGAFWARLADAKPIVRPLIEAGGLPSWLSSWLALPGLEMTGSFVHRPRVWDVRVEQAHSGVYVASGRWRTTAERTRAALLLARGPLEVGIAWTEGELELQLLGARQWLHSKLDQFPELDRFPALPEGRPSAGSERATD